ncbi:hypothetical protein ESY86_11375 [Subsaximicrobium wynnwilliamsii]|uniref:Uncharacterized protein n=1 Tax=Subsaximicrobium wynnwilliamsii TaxID=291179 RepID=A0A5C6ZI28_9FLAO|nr:hypothetical protein [Subsaximicrobium wynnwilliamsii]TXD83087.1 hypothetical protein ESY87_11410 [Subsaximicrobium wynnwilliamsii]TXD88831.1 hypothetical protein ESY86_11375 [Subsaximicrobium wynnwilliamsii]TXE02904.1 hypothetical protein ESY88_10430 [Subsaximicrobium wynnwilliamsii]
MRCGFGFCYDSNLNISFDCEPNTPKVSPRTENAAYNSTTQETKAVGVYDPVKNEIVFYFDKNSVGPPNHQPSDFTTLDVGVGFYLTSKIKLVEWILS